MRNELDNIVIQEPPIQELIKRKSCLKRGCLTGCGFIVIILIASVAILKFASTPKIKKLKQVPENFPQAVPVYDKDEINKITLTYGKNRSKAVEIAASLPKKILLPSIKALYERYYPSALDKNSEKNQRAKWYDLAQILKEKNSDRRDTVKIEWNPLPAEPKFIQQFYTQELEKNGFEVSEPSNTERTRKFTFQKAEIEGVLYIEDEPKNPGTDYFSLTIMSPPAE